MGVRVAPQNLPAPHTMPHDQLNQRLRDHYFGGGDQRSSQMKERIGTFDRRKFVAGSVGLLGLARSASGQQNSSARSGAYTDANFGGEPITGPFRPNWESLKAYQHPDGSGMRSSEFGPIGVLNVFPSKETGMLAACTYREAHSMTTTSRHMDIPPSLDTRTSAISGGRRTGIRKN
jgi:hypothetical protein